MYSLPQGRHWASPSYFDPSTNPFSHSSPGENLLAPCVLTTHLPKTGELGGGYLETEEGSAGCQCHSGWRGSQIS